mmetsp:Transcript_88020/g.168777  ORF Transcript_88020/g.168777 Transcript_88020/m.168777 type:complete len:175 (-) Transcript_88020:131-655(-)
MHLSDTHKDFWSVQLCNLCVVMAMSTYFITSVLLSVVVAEEMLVFRYKAPCTSANFQYVPMNKCFRHSSGQMSMATCSNSLYSRTNYAASDTVCSGSNVTAPFTLTVSGLCLGTYMPFDCVLKDCVWNSSSYGIQNHQCTNITTTTQAEIATTSAGRINFPFIVYACVFFVMAM